GERPLRALPGHAPGTHLALSALARLPGRAPLEHLVVRLVEPDLAIQRVRVLGVEDPAHAGEVAVLDHLAHEVLPQAAAAVLGQHVDVREVSDRDAVRGRATEADLPVAVVEPDDASRDVDQMLLCLARAADRPRS